MDEEDGGKGTRSSSPAIDLPEIVDEEMQQFRKKFMDRVLPGFRPPPDYSDLLFVSRRLISRSVLHEKDGHSHTVIPLSIFFSCWYQYPVTYDHSIYLTLTTGHM
jgi:hypothetical protein